MLSAGEAPLYWKDFWGLPSAIGVLRLLGRPATQDDLVTQDDSFAQHSSYPISLRQAPAQIFSIRMPLENTLVILVTP